jgi:hypothetical protein
VIYTCVGLAGAAIGMTAYLLLMAKRLESHSYRYLGMNLVAASLVAVSNIAQFNLPSCIMQAFYITVTFYGLCNVKKEINETP